MQTSWGSSHPTPKSTGGSYCPSKTNTMRKYTIRKGWHLSWPIVFPWPIFLPTFKGAKWRIVMDEDTIYRNPNNYQGWNKGGGWILSWFRNSRENHLWAWRWDHDLQAFQFTAYSNRPDVPKRRIVGWPDRGDVMLLAKPGDIVDITMRIWPNNAVRYTFRNLRSGVEHSCIHYTRRGTLLAYWAFVWFGGIYKAPRRVEFIMKRWKL